MQAAKPSQISLATSGGLGSACAWLVFGVAIFLVSVPVFVQAPLVRLLPAVSLTLTGGWLVFSCWLLSRPSTRLWGDILLGFALSWLAGSIYWSWLRWEPFLHLPVEAIGLPFVLWGFSQNWYKAGSFFYLGSLFGTVITDLYFYALDLVPYWRQLMQVDASLALPVFQEAIAQVQTPWGASLAVVLILILLAAGLLPLTLQNVRDAKFNQLHWWAFSGAVLGTLLVDGLFWITASTI